MEDKEDLIKATIKQLLQIANKYSRIERQPIHVDDDVEITTREAHTIQVVGEDKEINITDMATHFGVTKSAASQIVAKLTEKGFIEKMPAPHSNKELQLSLTRLGWQAFYAHERFHGKDMASLIRRLSAYPVQQIAVLSVLLEAIGTVMDDRLNE